MTMLGKERMSEIEDAALEVLSDTFGLNLSIPINLNKIVETEGLVLKIGEFKDSDILGAYSKKDKTIYVSESQPYTRQAFTVAHELGHYFLHKDFQDEVLLRSTDTESDFDNKETEANEFAANLTMPASLVEEYWPKTLDILRMAGLFSVSYSAMQWRLKNLDLLN